VAGPPNDDGRIEELYERFAPALKLFARRRGVPPEDCEDLVHDVFHRALNGWREDVVRDQTKLEGWIYGIFKNVVKDYHRRSQNRQRLLPPAGEQELERTGTFRDPDLDRHVRAAFARLSKRHRLALALNVVRGLTTNEIALILNRSSGRTGAILAEAKRLFRQYCDEGEENGRTKRLKE
jgi:RNA polymerase sigma factor (sigma-70 family)